MKFKDLPPLGGQLNNGIFAGLTTQKDGAHCAVVLLPGKGRYLNWEAAKAWAAEQGGERPSRPVASLLVTHLKDQLHPGWHWTSDEDSASCAWCCDFDGGGQSAIRKDFKGSAIAVQLVPLED